MVMMVTVMGVAQRSRGAMLCGRASMGGVVV